MNVKITKRFLSGVLAATLVMAPSMGVFASTNNASVATTTTNNAASTTTVDTFKNVKSVSTVAGITSTVKGAYLLEKGVAAAVSTPVTEISQGYALAAGETPYVKVFDMDVEKSNLAKATLDVAAAAYGGTNVGFVQMELGKMSSGEYSLLPAGAGIAVTFSVPKEAQSEGARYAVIRVVEGGVFTLLEDTDNDPATVSFVTTGGAGAYAIVKF